VGHHFRLRQLLTVLPAAALLVLGAAATAQAQPARRHRCHTASHAVHHRCRRAAHGTQAYRHHRRRPKAEHRSTTTRTAPTTAANTAQSDAATIAQVLATTCQNTEARPEAGNVDAVDAATLCLVNQVRARNGELPLRQNADLQEAASEHSREMVSDDYFAHVAPGGETPLERVRETGYVPDEQDGYTVGENIAWGTLQLSTPAAIVAAWVASPEHLANILDSSYRDTAVGVAPQAPPSLANGNPGAVYSQEFGVIVE
jgi:uncharacterized protein YkwD